MIIEVSIFTAGLIIVGLSLCKTLLEIKVDRLNSDKIIQLESRVSIYEAQFETAQDDLQLIECHHEEVVNDMHKLATKAASEILETRATIQHEMLDSSAETMANLLQYIDNAKRAK